MSDIWHNLRKENIGGSEIASLFDDGYSSQYRIFHQKKGNISVENLDEDERVQAGRYMESGALAWANAKWGTKFYQPNVYVKHPSIEGMGCTPDAFDSFSSGATSASPIIAQVKIVDGKEFKDHWEHDGDRVTEAPLKILLQCQHELACTGARENHLIVLVGGNRLYKMIILRDEAVIGIIERKVANFWHTIRENIEPEPKFKEDGDVIRSLRTHLPVVEEEDLSDDVYLGSLIQNLKASTFTRKKAADLEEAQRNEFIYCCEGIKRVRHGDNIIKFSTDKNGHLRVLINSEKVVYTTGEESHG